MPFLIVANWKMNGTRSSFIDFMDKLNSKSNEITSNLVICPSFTSFSGNIELRNNINIGAQNCHNKKSGSYTGEISAAMLKELGCTYVILGHSERINETDNEIKLKAEAAIESGLHPIICVGENLEDYKNEKTKEVIERQCKNRLPIHGEYTIAYEPIWAIGTGNIPSNDAIAEVIGLLHNHYLSEKLVTSSSVSFQRVTLESRKEEWIPVSSTGMTEDNAGGLIKSCTSKQRIIYGGSVNLENIENLLNISNLSGVLIGSASLDFDHFYGIVQKVEKRKYNI